MEKKGGHLFCGAGERAVLRVPGPVFAVQKKKVLSIVTFYKCTQALTFSPFFFCDSVAETIIGKKF
jgi:hypothetical protein